MNLHDWTDELCDALDIDLEIDEALILDVARVAAHAVTRPAAPISTFLLGYAAAVNGASPEAVEELAARAMALAEKWDVADDKDVKVAGEVADKDEVAGGAEVADKDEVAGGAEVAAKGELPDEDLVDIE